MTRVLLTGATGFVGRALAPALAEAGYTVRAALRTERHVAPPGCAETVVVGDIGTNTDWSAALRDVEHVVHAAARAHVLRDKANPDAYLETNARGTQRLATAASTGGVRRFLFLSSVKVNGEQTRGRAYTSADEPRPRDPYAISKWIAEQRLREVAAAGSMEAVLVRAPLVYGPGVRANFLRMMRWVERGWPLPLRSVNNSRSLISVWNLSDLIVNLMRNPAAPGGTWMAADGEDLSTPELLTRLGRALGRRVRLLPVPVGLLRLAAVAVGRGEQIARLCGSLVVDVSQTRNQLGWSAPVAVDEGLARTAAWYLSGDR
jgi:nucleoside-diphosphate-sugar epimerase